MKKFLSIIMMALCMCFVACNGHKKKAADGFISEGYNYEQVVKADYDFIAGKYSDFRFYEVDVLFKDVLCNEGTPEIISIRTVFQCNDTCIMFLHSHGEEDTTYVQGYWLECMDMSAYNAVTYDSCMTIIEPYRHNMYTRALTFRRVLAPPFPEHGQYIFGKGVVVVDSYDGHVESWIDG